MLGLLGFASSQILFGLGTSLPMLYLARLAGGAAGAALLTASSAVVAGPAAGGLLLAANARAPFMITAVLASAVSVWLMFSRPTESVQE